MTSSNGHIFCVTGPLCGYSPVTGEFPSRRPVTRSFEVFSDLRLNKRLNKPSWGWWFETPSCSLWRHCHGLILQQCQRRSEGSLWECVMSPDVSPDNNVSQIEWYMTFHRWWTTTLTGKNSIGMESHILSHIPVFKLLTKIPLESLRIYFHMINRNGQPIKIYIILEIAKISLNRKVTVYIPGNAISLQWYLAFQ